MYRDFGIGSLRETHAECKEENQQNWKTLIKRQEEFGLDYMMYAID